MFNNMVHLILIKLIILSLFTKPNLSYPSQNTPSIESTEPNRDPNFNAAANDDISYLANDKIININNPDQNDMIQIKEMNVNLTAIRIQQEQLKTKYRGSLQVPNNLQQQPLTMRRHDESDVNESRAVDRREFEELAREQIRQVLATNLIRDPENANSERRLPDDIHHYTAVYPQCNPPKTINATTFFNSGNTWNLYFSPPASDNPLNAILRLYKLPVIENSGEQLANCSQSEDLIRITVSYYIKRREKRKRMCSSRMLSRYATGWIELDVKSAIKYWNKPTPNQTKRNYGIAIDVQDQDEQTLHAASFFQGNTCEANTSPAIPWNIYEEQSTDNIYYTVPKSPRIDYEIHQRGHTILPHYPSSLSSTNNLFSHYTMNGGYQTEPQSISTMSDELDADSESRENFDSNMNVKKKKNKNNENHRHHHRHRTHHQSNQPQSNYYTTQNSQTSKYYRRK